MSELFDIDDEEQPIEEEALVQDTYKSSPSDARRRLERLLAEKKLRDELEDFFDDFEEERI
jgi:hypothetical protein